MRFAPSPQRMNLEKSKQESYTVPIYKCEKRHTSETNNEKHEITRRIQRIRSRVEEMLTECGVSRRVHPRILWRYIRYRPRTCCSFVLHTTPAGLQPRTKSYILRPIRAFHQSHSTVPIDTYLIPAIFFCFSVFHLPPTYPGFEVL